MNNPEGSQFLKEKYDLHNQPEIKSAAKRTEIRAGEKVSQEPSAQIQNYLDRFQEILDRKDPDKRERGIKALKRILHKENVINPAEIPEAYFENQRRIAREQGHGNIENTRQMRDQLTEVIITDQKSSLDKWVDYLASSDATYPMWLKYYALRNIVGLGDYDKKKKQFSKRSKGTTKPFPDLNREALAYVLDAINKKAQEEHIDTEKLSSDEQKQFDKLLQGANFGKLYAWAIEKVTPASQEALKKTQGKWVKYDQGSDHMPLVKSLQGHGTGWCTAGESTAQIQLQNGDFYVYYSYDQQGKPTIPRVAIRMNGQNEIGEVRGIAYEQNLDPEISESKALKEKLAEFGEEGKRYEKRLSDMKHLTNIENKMFKEEELTKEDLRFIYEIDNQIEGFGYEADDRIDEILHSRIMMPDLKLLYNVGEDQIARGISQINDKTVMLIHSVDYEDLEKIFKITRNLKIIIGNVHIYKVNKENVYLENVEYISGNLYVVDIPSQNTHYHFDHLKRVGGLTSRYEIISYLREIVGTKISYINDLDEEEKQIEYQQGVDSYFYDRDYEEDYEEDY